VGPSLLGALRVPRPGLKIIESAAMIAATAAAATVGAVLVIGPGGAAAAGGPGYALAASDSPARCTPGRAAAVLPQAVHRGPRARARLATGLAAPAARRRASQWARLRLPARGQSHPEGRPGGDGHVTVTQTVARLAARARGPARRRYSFDIADSELES
jgi:hypothetical protein